MVEFPLGVFGIALSTVILPSLSQSHAAEAPERFNRTLDQALRWVVLLGVPATLGLLLLAGPIIVTLFQTALALGAYALGLPAFILVKVLAPGFYSRQDTATPVRIGIQAMVANMAMNLAFVVPMVMAGFRAPHMGLALATAASAWLNAGLLYRRLRRDGVYAPEAGWAKVGLRVALAGGAMAALILWGVPGFSAWLTLGGMERAWRLAAWIAAAGALYLLVLQLSGQRLQDLWRRNP